MIDPGYDHDVPRDLVGFVAFHLPRAIEFAERDVAQVRASARHYRAVYAARNRCPVGHQVSDHEPCGYCKNADAGWVESLADLCPPAREHT